MRIKLSINRHTTESELIHLGMFFTSLGLNRGARVATTGSTAEPTFSVLPDEAELSEPDTTIIPGAEVPAPAHAEAQAGTEAPKRRRRTKEEVEAERIAKAEADAHASNTAELVKLQTQPEEVAAVEPEVPVGNETPAPTQTVPVTDTVLEPAATVAASASPSEPVGPITHAEAQKYAIDAARRFGPEKVKAIIAEYEGVGKIADLPEAALSGFIVKLQALAA